MKDINEYATQSNALQSINEYGTQNNTLQNINDYTIQQQAQVQAQATQSGIGVAGAVVEVGAEAAVWSVGRAVSGSPVGGGDISDIGEISGGITNAAAEALMEGAAEASGTIFEGAVMFLCECVCNLVCGILENV